MKNIIASLFIAGFVLACGTSQKSVEQATETTENKEPTPIATAVVEGKSEEDMIEQASTDQTKPPQTKPQIIEWMDFETAIERNKKSPKYIFIDVYTDWCGWCKKMDASTFVDPKVVNFMTENVYAVKMDAESKEAIAYNDHLYEFKQFTPKGGYNTLAVSLLDSKMSFPSFVILNKKETKQGKIMGYKVPSEFLALLRKYVK